MAHSNRAFMPFSVDRLHGRENYDTWAVAAKHYLSHENLWRTIAVVPPHEALDEDLDRNRLAVSKIVLLVDPVCYSHVQNATTAKEAWENLEKAFANDGLCSSVELLRTISTTRLVDCETPDEYINKIKKAADQLKAQGTILQDELIANFMLVGLPAEYSPMIMAISSLGQRLSSDSVQNKILKDCRMSTDGNGSLNLNVSTSGFAASNFSRRGRNNSRQRGNQRNQNFSRRGGRQNNNNMSMVRCYNCGRRGHYAQQCYVNKNNTALNSLHTQIDESSNSNNVQQNSALPQNLITNTCLDKKDVYSFLVMAATKMEADFWIIDSGASRHLCKQKELLINFRPSSTHHVTAANSQILDAKSQGEVFLNARNQVFKLNNTLFVPNLCCNLLSVPCINKSGFDVVFSHDLTCKIINYVTNRVIATGFLLESQNVYILNAKNVLNPSQNLLKHSLCLQSTTDNRLTSTYNIPKKINQRTWHRRLGHAHFDIMKQLKNGAANGIFFTEDQHQEICHDCVKGKYQKRTFAPSQSQAKTRLELIHTDLCTIETRSIGENAKYFATFIDDFSRMVFIYLLKEKSELAKVFKEFKAQIENQTGQKIKTLRSDNGGEYIASELKQFLVENGIFHQFTVPYNPSQNGKAERMNRTLVEKARCLLLDANLSKNFWGEAIKVAAYIANRLPRIALGGKTPFEMWYQQKPDLTHLRIFGCKAEAYIPKELRSKLDPKTVDCIMMGYASNQKAYKLFNPVTKKFFVSRDVVFFETGIRVNKPQEEEKIKEISQNQDEIIIIPDSCFEDEPQEEEQQEVEIDENVNLDHNLMDFEEPNNSTDVSSLDLTQLPQDSDDSNQQRSKNVSQHSSPATSSDMEIDNSITSKYQVQLRPTRKVKLPFKFKDYVMDFNSMCLNVFQCIEPSSLNDFVRHVYKTVEIQDTSNLHEIPLYAFVTDYDEPQSYDEAINCSEAVLWTEAMMKELQSIKDNDTWDLVDLPIGRRPVSSKWVFKKKKTIDGNIQYKARLVARGFSQIPGMDFHETYSPVVRFTTLRMLFAQSINRDMEIYHLDVDSAFLHGDLKEEIFMNQPEGFEEGKKVWKLKKAIYGLRQGSRAWHEKIREFFKALYYRQSVSDQSVYFYFEELQIIYVAVFVDDLVVFTNSTQLLDKLKNELVKNFPIKDLGVATNILGINIVRNRQNNSISLDQSHYIDLVLNKFGMQNCKPIDSPLDVQNCDLSKDLTPKTTEEQEKLKKIPYQSAIGCLMYLLQGTRPDLAYVLSSLSRFNQDYTEKHWRMLKRVLRYLKYSRDLKLTYRKDVPGYISGEQSAANSNKHPLQVLHEKILTGYCDASLGSRATDDPKSISGYVFLSQGGAVSWSSKKQTVIALSTVEAEYYAITSAAQEAVWLRGLCIELGLLSHERPILLKGDNQGAIDLSKNAGYSARTRHIDLRHHFIKGLVENKTILLEYVPTKLNLADIFTKPSSKGAIQFCNEHMGLKS